VDALSRRSLNDRLEKRRAKNARSPRRKRAPESDAAKNAAKLDSKLARLAAQGGSERVRVIIRVRPGSERKVDSAIRRAGFSSRGKLPLIGSIVATIPVGALDILANHPDVLGISSDEVVRTQGAKKQRDIGGTGKGGPNATSDTTDTDSTSAASTSSTSTGGSWQTESLVANHLLNTLGLDVEPWSGDGVHVAIIDSGVAAFYELSLFGTWSFLNGAYPSNSDWVPDRDPYGHGTHVAGLIANDGAESGGLFRGVAANIDRIYSLRVLDKYGAGYTSDVIRAIQWTIENSRAKIDIINLSLGHPILEPAATDPLVQAVEAAVRAGIVVVVSAGNYGYDRETGYAGISSPGNAPSAITVGAIDTLLTDTRSDDGVARYSSRGPTWYDAFAKPDIVAPGSALMSTTSPGSTLLFDNPQLDVDTLNLNGVLHTRLSGTSMAAAVTTGVVARMISAQKQVFGRKARPTPNVVKAMLQYSALPLADPDVLTQGAGALNADGAVALAASIDTSAPDGEWWLTAPTTETSTIVGETLTWGQRFIWGDRFIWGSTIYYANTEVWSPATVWGDRFIWGSQIDWDDLSTSVVWGDRFIWGSNIVWGDNLIEIDESSETLWGDRFIWGYRFIWGAADEGSMGVR
jgi:serine protease AprX